MKILLVDDSHTERLVIKSYLSTLNYEVTLAEDGEKALAAFEQERPDLILLDVVLPGISGFEVAQKIRELEQDWIPIIFLSGMNTPEDIQRGIESGGDDYLTKPVRRIVLNAKMQAMERLYTMRSEMVELTNQLEQANHELAKQARIDGLTGVANRRELDEQLRRSFFRARRQQESICLLMVDVDCFKQFNDHYGHLLGDDCLKKVADILSQAINRPDDLVTRYGGEEFAVLLPNTRVGGGTHIAERIINAMAEANIAHQHSPLGRLSVSIGISVMVPTNAQQLESFIHHADQALYEAKRNGRNTFELVEVNVDETAA